MGANNPTKEIKSISNRCLETAQQLSRQASFPNHWLSLAKKLYLNASQGTWSGINLGVSSQWNW